MKYRQLTILLPCHSLEDFPTHHEGDAAQGLLANWTALWHPALLAATAALPSWYRADSAPTDIAGHLIVVPSVGAAELPTGFAERAESTGAVVLRDGLHRDEIVAAALAGLDGGDGGVEADLAADFLALGYAYLQVELLTRQLRYSSNLDQIHFQSLVIDGAAAAMRGDAEEARRKLTACFDLLSAERDHYYPVEAFVLDLTLATAATIGQTLRTALSVATPLNLILPAEALRQMAATEPASLAMLREGVAQGRVAVLGGEEVERCSSLMPSEAVLAELRRGLAIYEELLGRRPTVFARRRFGLVPLLPPVLSKLSFDAALHVGLEEGTCPEGSQCKVRWEGCDATSIEAIARPPLDAAKPESYLKFAVKMGESMDLDHVATMCLAHWPGAHAPWLDDLRRIAKYGSTLGKFATLEEYFRQTAQPSHQDRFQVDQYRSPYLRQAVAGQQVDPISSTVRYWRRRTAARAAASLHFLGEMLAGRKLGAGDMAAGDDGFRRLLDETDRSFGVFPERESLDERLQQATQEALAALAVHLPRANQPAQSGCLIVNPLSFTRRTGVESLELPGLPAVERPVYAVGETSGAKHAVVDVPPLGFVWAAPAAVPTRARKNEQPITDTCLLRNEFFEVLIDEATGGLRAIYEYGARGNRLSQQVALRSPGKKKPKADGTGEEESAVYTTMVAESIQTTVATPVLGEIVTNGRLVDRRGQTMAGFRQTFRLWRGSRVLHLDVELDPQTECPPDPWNSYYGLRFAWANDVAELFRAVNDGRHRTTAKRFEAPQYIEIEDGGNRTTILTGGLPFHRRQGTRMLDTLLIVHGERARRFQLGIGVSLKHPLQEALSLLTPPAMLYQTAAPPSPAASGWLFHVDARNVTATHWESVLDGERIVGFRVRLLETGGRSANATLKAFRPLSLARRLDFRGAPQADCPLQNGDLPLQFGMHEWLQIEAFW